MESNLDINKGINKGINKYKFKGIFIPSNNLHIVTEKNKIIEKVSLNTKLNYTNYDEKLIDIIIDIVINILEKEKNIISIDKLNNKVIENIPDKYASFYYLNKTIYDSIILNIYGKLFKAHGFIDDCKVFLEKFNYLKDEIKLDKNILINYYNLFLHAKNLFTSTSLEYTTNMISCILENNSFYGIIRSFVAPTTFGKSSGSASEQALLDPAEHCLILCKYVCNNNIKQSNNRYYSKNKIVKSSKKVKKPILKTIVSDSTFNESNIFHDDNGVFRKLHQPAAIPVAPHPRYSISEDRNDGDIQALLEAAENDEETNSSNISNDNYDFDLFEKDIFEMMDGNI
jgi:hypothetical protein